MTSVGVRWGLIGAGDIVRKRVAGALRDAPASEIVAVSRARNELAESFAHEIGARRWHGDWRALVADADVTAVYIATPVHVHAAQTIAAAEAGKHVLCEKPMAMSAGECDRMIAACRANGVRLGIAYYRRFYPAVIRVKDIIASGEIGEPVFAQMNAFEHFNPDANYPRAWLLQPSMAGGGPMMDFGCHRIEVLLNLFGAVRETAAITSNVVFKREVEDTAAVLLRFDGGPCASVAVTHASHERQDTLHVFGSRGAIHVDDLNAGELRVRTDTERVESHPPAGERPSAARRRFRRRRAASREPAVTGEIGRAVAAIEDAIYAVAPSAR